MEVFKKPVSAFRADAHGSAEDQLRLVIELPG